MNGELYFAYGCNIEPGHVARLCPTARAVSGARLADHRLTFPLRCASWGGAVASIEPSPAAEVWGVLWEVDGDSLAALDAYEEVAEGMYRRVRVEVESNGGRRPCWSYVARPDEVAPGPPSRRYMAALIGGARHFGLPEQYVATLEAVQTR